MSDDNDNRLTKPKKERSEAQKAAYLKMVEARETKLAAKPAPQPKEVKLTPQEKKLRLQAIKEQLAGKKAEPVEEEDESEEEVEQVIAPKKIKKEKQREKVDEPIMRLPKKQPKIVYQDPESDSDASSEVIVVKRRKKEKTKKTKKKTIIYEDSSSEEEEEEPVKPVRKERETKTQQNAGSKFKVTPAVAEKPKGPVYYFAD
jgi:hypothetical protein